MDRLLKIFKAPSLLSLFVNLSIILSNYCYAKDKLDLIQPTGNWYEEASIKLGELDSCWERTSTTNFKYKNLFQSLEQAKNELYKANYKGGSCKESISIIDEEYYPPDDWPILFGTSSSWEEYKKNNSAPLPKYYEYSCNNEDGSYYFFSFTIQPQYKCIDGSCNSYKKACAGDVYAGDLLQSHAEFLGHTGIIVTPDTERNPISDNMVMEVLQTPPIIHFEKTLGMIEQERPVWGVRYGFGKIQKGEMTSEEANEIFYEGIRQSQYCPQYTLQPIYHAGGPEIISITNPLTNKFRKILISNCAVFRCDTFVKYLYKTKLKTDLPPYNITQAPKDLFDAFLNQRGEVPPYFSDQIILDIQKINIVDESKVNNQILWQSFLNNANNNYQKMSMLENITNTQPIAYQELLNAINLETDLEIKARLLLLLKQKLMSNQKIESKYWINSNQITDSIINQSMNPKVLVNAILVQRITQPPEKLIKNIDNLTYRIQSVFLEEEKLYIEKTATLILFEILANSSNQEISNQVIKAVKNFNSLQHIEGFSIFVKDYPQLNNEYSRKLVHKYLTNIEPTYFNSQKQLINDMRAKTWSSAVLKLSNNKDEFMSSLYQLANKANDEYVAALLIIENKHYFSQKDKKKYMDIMNKKNNNLFHYKKPPFKKITINKARQFLNNE